MSSEAQSPNAAAPYRLTRNSDLEEAVIREDCDESNTATIQTPSDDYKLMRYGMIDLHGLSWTQARENIPKHVKLDDIMLGIVLLISKSADRVRCGNTDLDATGSVLVHRKSIGEAPLVKHGEKYYYWICARSYALIGDDMLSERERYVGTTYQDRRAAQADATEVSYGRLEAKGPRDLDRTLIIDYTDGFVNDPNLPWQSIGAHNERRRISFKRYQTAQEKLYRAGSKAPTKLAPTETGMRGTSSVTPSIPSAPKLEQGRGGNLAGDREDDEFQNDRNDQGYNSDTSNTTKLSRQRNSAGPLHNARAHVSTLVSSPLVSKPSKHESRPLSPASNPQPSGTTAHNTQRPQQQTLNTEPPTTARVDLPSAPQDEGESGPSQHQRQPVRTSDGRMSISAVLN